MWLAGIVTVFSLVGNNPYFGSLYALILLMFVSVWVIYHKAIPALFEKSWKNVSSFLFFIATAGLFLYFASHMLDYFAMHRFGRDSETSVTPLPTFLTLGSGIGWHGFLELLFAGPGGDYTGYLGLLPLVFFCMAC